MVEAFRVPGTILIPSNAMTYNPPGNDFHIIADTLSKFFEARWKVIANKLLKDSQPLPEKLDVHGEKGTIKPMPPSKKRKLTSPQHKAMPGRAKRIMTYEEKHKLSRDFEALLGELPDNIFEFVRDQISNGWEAREDEIEVYIDDLSDNTLFMLRKLLDDYLRETRKNQAKAKPCEIEVLNGSWLSDLSMQFLCKGY
ncbi:transcription factor GTE9-like [Camellia sinensis]|uniref:transcription factor GTE9-like n=1 Tax=Camellia sinensis TaxID=4442 RepID=UPI001035CBAC|nr:transcription factor GTE9-like [Camellia sinensis]